MKKWILALTILLFCGGCAQEARNIDREWGQAQMASWDKQIAYPDYRFAGKTPEGMTGINAEQVMDIYTRTYGEKPEKTDTYNLQFVPGGMGGQ